LQQRFAMPVAVWNRGSNTQAAKAQAAE
jgi:hypothetical protein